MAAGTAAAARGLDSALDEAVERITDLSARLWAVRAAHRAVIIKPLLRPARLVCTGCGRSAPCPTVRAAGNLPAEEIAPR